MKKIILAFCLTLGALIVWGIQAFAFTSTSWSGTNFIAGQTGTYTFEFTTSETTFWNPGDGDDGPYIDFNFPEGFEYVGDDLAGDVLISFDGGENYSPITAEGTNSLRIYFCEDGAGPCTDSDGFQFPTGIEYVVSIANIQNIDEAGVYPRPNDALSTPGEGPILSSLVPDITIVDESVSTPFERCATNSGSINIPYQECIGLAYLYTETDGDNWINNNDWFDDVDVTNWNTAYCEGNSDDDLTFYETFCINDGWFGDEEDTRAIYLSGDAGSGKLHVYGLMLTSNNLSGAIQSGLIYFPELTYAELDYNKEDYAYDEELDDYVDVGGITSANFSQNTKLFYLAIGDNSIANPWNLNLSNNPALRYLEADDLDLADGSLILHATATANLIYLYLDGNEYEDFDFAPFTKLRYLLFADNLLSLISVASNTGLVYLDFEDNLLTSLDLSNNIALRVLDLEDNQITSISLDYNSNLEDLDLDGNQLTYLNLENNLKLEEADLTYNELENIVFAPMEDYTSLIGVNVDYNKLCTLTTNSNNILDEFSHEEDWRAYQVGYCPAINMQASGGDTKVDLTWTTPAEQEEYEGVCEGVDSSECLQNYILYIFQGEDSVGDPITLEPDTTSYTVTDLVNNNEYLFRLCAIYSDGEGTEEACTDTTSTPNGEEEEEETPPVVVPSGGGGGYGSSNGSSSSSSSSNNNPNPNTNPTINTGTNTGVVTATPEVDMTIFNASISTDTCFVPMNIHTVDQGNDVSALFKVAHQMLYSYGLTTIPGTRDFGPYRQITRGEAAKFFVQFAQNVLCKKTIQTYDNRFTDISGVHADLQANIILSYEYGIFYGSEGGKFNPNSYITQDELTAVIIRLVTGKYNDAEGANRAANYINTLQSKTTIDLINTTRGKLSEALYDLYKNNNYNLESAGYVIE